MIHIDCIIKNNTHEDEIIKYSIKFMRLLSSYIVDQGWEHNTEDRVTYRGIDVPVMKEAEEGKTYRLITIWKSYIKFKTKYILNQPIFLHLFCFVSYEHTYNILLYVYLYSLSLLSKQLLKS